MEHTICTLVTGNTSPPQRHVCPPGPLWIVKPFEKSALLGHYVASSGNFLPTFSEQPVGLRMGPIRRPETSVRKYDYSPRNNPEDGSSQLLRGGKPEITHVNPLLNVPLSRTLHLRTTDKTRILTCTVMITSKLKVAAAVLQSSCSVSKCAAL